MGIEAELTKSRESSIFSTPSFSIEEYSKNSSQQEIIIIVGQYLEYLLEIGNKDERDIIQEEDMFEGSMIKRAGGNMEGIFKNLEFIHRFIQNEVEFKEPTERTLIEAYKNLVEGVISPKVPYAEALFKKNLPGKLREKAFSRIDPQEKIKLNKNLKVILSAMKIFKRIASKEQVDSLIEEKSFSLQRMINFFPNNSKTERNIVRMLKETWNLFARKKDVGRSV